MVWQAWGDQLKAKSKRSLSIGMGLRGKMERKVEK